MTTGKLIRHFMLGLVLLGLVWGLAGCNKMGGSSAKDPNVDYYTCTMHPSVKSQDPNGKCPICSMDLVPVMKKGANAGAGGHQGDAKNMTGEMKTTSGQMFNEFFVPVERQQQIGVTYAVAEKKPLHHRIRSVGMIVPDRSRQWSYVARVEGYVEKLYVTSPGEAVRSGAPLLTIYSPELLTAERELVNLLETRDHAASPENRASTERLLDASRRRLEQWNITAPQIAQLEKSRKPSEFLTLNSPFDGVVQDVPVEQGRRVMIGDPLVTVADLSVVWVWAEFYEDELAMLAKGLKLGLTAKSYPGQTFEGEIGLINPFLDETKRTAKVRIDIPNSDRKLRPGMYLNIDLAMDMGEGLTIPVSAVMPTGLRTLVFVDKGAGKLEPRLVQLGGKYGDIYEVQSGLTDGERVVASANFLIDAESKVQGAVKSFEEPPAADAEKPAMTMESRPAPLPNEARALYQPVLASYLAIQQQLAKDKLDGLAAEVARLGKQVQVVAKSDVKPTDRADDYIKHIGALAAALDAFQAGNLDEARVAFGKVSAALISVLTEFPPPLESALHIMNCPMWDKSPASWLQAPETVENPFLGVKMPHCGDLVKTMEAAK
jgi:membrane fusion protein, copper/silver efflux system